ncbi:hypothetical protein NQ315_007604 [Exocentrus adspersus]|uniref:Nose resistant-to-fluoxetine protein N-terminal domain-containing protein n=1 Tax=Exocentrus adspersus TaxID=1586481 RepID=A0AAV8W877_9CUCU|nr:hypothetical protein NQ315_007604 [Exocentrus adspersus]
MEWTRSRFAIRKHRKIRDFELGFRHWADLLDASSKFPYSGLGYASKMDYGNFDQCVSVDYSFNGTRVLGKHCTVGMVLPDMNDNMSDPNTYYRLAMCRPDGCSASDFNYMLQSLVTLDIPAPFQEIMCQTAEANKPFTASDIAVLTIFAVVIFLMTVSTAYDTYLHYNELKSSHPLLLAFSVLSNGRKLLHISKHSTSKEHIETFFGLRVISMMWIVAGHGFVGWQNVSVSNRDVVNNWLDQRYALYITTSPLAVDTFFYMSGFLLAFQYLKSKSKPVMKQVLSIPHMYIHRYLRLTPAVLMIYLTVISFFKHMGSGPLWPSQESLAKSCREHWWAFFLYIQNYYNYKDLCITQTWYLSADMQMFILSPLILIPLSIILKRKSGFAISMSELLVLNLFCTFMPMLLKFHIRDYDNEYDTHSRLINYFIGMMLGVFMREKIDKPFLYIVKEQHRYLINILMWTFILLGLLATIVCYQEVLMWHDYDSTVLLDSLKRPAWCIGLSWITYSCYHGYGGFVNWILCRPIFQILGRLTYCIYLVHGSVIIYYILCTRVPWFFTNYNAFYMFCGHYVMSVLVAIFWTLAFESPLIIVEKFLMGGGSRAVKATPATATNNNETTPKKDALFQSPIFVKPTPSGDNNEAEPVKEMYQHRYDDEVPPDAELGGGVYKRRTENYKLVSSFVFWDIFTSKNIVSSLTKFDFSNVECGMKMNVEEDS